MERTQIISKVKRIDKIYHEFLEEIKALKRKQNLLIENYINELEKAKIEEVKKGLQDN